MLVSDYLMIYMWIIIIAYLCVDAEKYKTRL